ncbi:MAG: hypothetical protein ABI330_10850 [Caldimonas sp.]
MSASGAQSCSTCHVAAHAVAGAGGLPTPLGGPNMDQPTASSRSACKRLPRPQPADEELRSRLQ